MFELDSRLENDTLRLASWPLCEVLLMNDVQFPWVILVPRVAGATELYLLDKAQREQLDVESTFLSEAIMALFEGKKLNVAALGNVVSQLHIHHVVRYEDDLTWPAPIWGKLPAVTYSDEQLKMITEKLAIVINQVWSR